MSSPEPSERTIYSIDTELPADSVEFCPRTESNRVLVCGTYNLVKREDGEKDPDTASGSNPQERNGRCLVYETDATSQNLKEIQRIETAAILDLKWSYHQASLNPVLAIAESVGRIQLHEWREQEKTLSAVQSIQVAESHVLCLSIDWNNRLSNEAGELVVSRSDGALSTLKSNGSRFDVELTWHAHDFEPWVAAWNYWTPNIIYSGGDDCKLKGWDTRTSCSSPTFTNKRFDAGVTCIQVHPYVENIVAVGSYDNTVRIFDSRKMGAPLTDVDVGGGAWRVKWHPSRSNKEDLLVACMHDGFKVVRCAFEGKDSEATISDSPGILSRFNAHTSLAYGVDWQHGSLQDCASESIVASCSFYDHMLCLWSPRAE